MYSRYRNNDKTAGKKHSVPMFGENDESLSMWKDGEPPIPYEKFTDERKTIAFFFFKK